MANTRGSKTDRSGLANKPYSATLGVLVVTSYLLCALSGALLAIDFLGYHVPDRPPHPIALILMLVLGLAIAAAAHFFGAGRNEGISAQGWLGVADVLHIRLAFASLMFLGGVFKYAVAGKSIPLYPVGLLVLICGFVLLSRLVTKRIFKLDHRKHTQG